MNHPSIFRVLNDNDTVVGAAFLVTERLVATCAHVIKDAGRTSGDTVTLRLEDGASVTALVLRDYWRDVQAEDIAMLRLEKSLDGIQPLILSPAREAIKHKFSSYGFPNPAHELTGRGKIVDIARINGLDLLQLDSKQVTPGFSGAPVIDENNPYLKRVVGMVVSITPPDKYLRQGTTALATLAETLHQVCPEIPIETTFEATGREFLELPGLGAVDLSVMQKIYRLCFDGTTLLEPLPPNTRLPEMIAHLAQAIPLPKNYAHPLACFAVTLADCLQFSDAKLSGEILAWLKKYSGKLMLDWHHRAALIRRDPKDVDPPCLQIILNENTVSNQPNGDPKNKRYLLKARDARANRQLFCEPNTEFGKLASIIRQVAIVKILERLDCDEASAFKDQLWIEFVLNTEDLSRKVDHWKADDQTNETLGQTYKLVVRSPDRLKNLIHFHKTWPGKWTKCHAAIKNDFVDLKHGMVKERNLSAFQKAIEHLHVIGLPFDLGDGEANGDLLTSLLESGVPVAVWTRRGVDSQLAEEWLEKRLTDPLDLHHLAGYVRKERQSGSELGKALVLLWDNYDHKLGEEDSFVAPVFQSEENAW